MDEERKKELMKLKKAELIEMIGELEGSVESITAPGFAIGDVVSMDPAGTTTRIVIDLESDWWSVREWPKRVAVFDDESLPQSLADLAGGGQQ